MNAVDYSGDTPLHRAVGFDHIEIVRLLLDRGASANVKNKEGKTPIDDAESDEIKQLLLEHLGK